MIRIRVDPDPDPQHWFYKIKKGLNIYSKGVIDLQQIFTSDAL